MRGSIKDDNFFIMKLLHRHRYNIFSRRCWFWSSSQCHGGVPSGRRSNREKLAPHIHKWNVKRETLCERNPADCIVNIHSFLDIIHQLNPSWATEKSLDLKNIKEEFNHSCMALCSGCELNRG